MKSLFISVLFSMLLPYVTGCRNGGVSSNVQANVKLGQYLFYEKQLSFNHTRSCANCHSPVYAFSDGYRRSIAADGENLMHNAPSLLNIADQQFYDWDNPAIRTLQDQIKRPLYHQTPREMAFNAQEPALVKYFSNSTLYQKLFAEAFPDEEKKFSGEQIEASIVAYVKTLKSRKSRYDRYIRGDQQALTADELAGLDLFSSQQLQCRNCHPPPDFTLATRQADIASVYVNTGLYPDLSPADSNFQDTGLMRYTHNKADYGKFKIPSLRNIAVTAPYMHDGSVTSLSDVIDVYARGGRKIDYGPYQGDGALCQNKHPFIRGFHITKKEKKQLISFLEALTDTTYLHDPRFLDPFHQ